MCGSKVRFLSPVPEKKRPRAGPGISQVPRIGRANPLGVNSAVCGIHSSPGHREALESGSGPCPDAATHWLCDLHQDETPHSPPLTEGLMASIMFRDIKYLDQGPAESASSVLLLLQW